MDSISVVCYSSDIATDNLIVYSADINPRKDSPHTAMINARRIGLVGACGSGLIQIIKIETGSTIHNSAIVQLGAPTAYKNTATVCPVAVFQ